MNDGVGVESEGELGFFAVGDFFWVDVGSGELWDFCDI